MMRSETFILLSFFISLIIIGTVFLLLPLSWNGTEPLSVINAFFTSTSAVCVTGLITVDTSLYSRFGQIVILLLIQMGGLGLISFSTLYIVLPSRKISLKGSTMIKEYFLDSVEFEPRKIISLIFFFTLFIEAIGTVFLYFGFSETMKEDAFYYALFHSISAFCNAGFSLFPNNLENYKNNELINITIMLLIILGGIGFIVLRDLIKRIKGEKKHIALHTKMVLITSIFLIIFGSIMIFFIESNHLLKEHSLKDKILISLFQAVTPRTAGFNTVPFNEMFPIVQFLLIPFMIIGGAPGSISGGIKVTTFFILFLVLTKRINPEKGISIFKRRVPPHTIYRISIFTIKAITFLILSFSLLVLSESVFHSGTEHSFLELFFESASAFGTVGLSLGITAGLSLFGKVIIILTMLLGRIGLLILMMNIFTSNNNHEIIYPAGEVLTN
ncbi:MAG: potassium transporter [Spirochaetales bacterium]|nr:potassium transporter [Spirochaetales bacterium]